LFFVLLLERATAEPLCFNILRVRPPPATSFYFFVEQFFLEFDSLFCVRYKGSTSSVCNAGTLQVTYWPNSRSCAGAGQNDTIAAGVCMLSSDAISYVRIVC
jgi:hypothetical protein